MNWLPTGFTCLLFVIKNFFYHRDIEQTRFLDKGPRRSLKQELAKKESIHSELGGKKDIFFRKVKIGP